jgi:hypothetical protein
MRAFDGSMKVREMRVTAGIGMPAGAIRYRIAWLSSSMEAVCAAVPDSVHGERTAALATS